MNTQPFLRASNIYIDDWISNAQRRYTCRSLQNALQLRSQYTAFWPAQALMKTSPSDEDQDALESVSTTP